MLGFVLADTSYPYHKRATYFRHADASPKQRPRTNSPDDLNLPRNKALGLVRAQPPTSHHAGSNFFGTIYSMHSSVILSRPSSPMLPSQRSLDRKYATTQHSQCHEMASIDDLHVHCQLTSDPRKFLADDGCSQRCLI